MKSCYQAWDIQLNNFYTLSSQGERLLFLIRLAILAPSSHNAQPWKFSVSPDSIAVSVDKKRLLPVSDPYNRHAYISLGAVTENIITACAYFGVKCKVSILRIDDQVEIHIVFDDNVLVKPQEPRLHPAQFISMRVSNRSAYSAQSLSAEMCAQLAAISTSHVSVTVVSDMHTKRNIAKHLQTSREKLFESKKFRVEIAKYKRNNFTRRGTGMPGFTMGFSNIQSIVAPYVIRACNVAKLFHEKDIRLFSEETASLLFISTNQNSEEIWIEAGQVLQRILLHSEMHGLASSLSAVPHQSYELKQILGTTYAPLLMMRLGYTNDIPRHSPRLAIKEIS